MHDDTTWESADWRCPVCMQLYSPVSGDSKEPLFICKNMHCMCRSCATEHMNRKNSCPQCRIKCNDLQECSTNRYIMSFLEKFSLRCGSCSLDKKMTYEEITKHALECPMLRMQCPFPHAVCPENICSQNLVISSLWEHCKSVHASESHIIDCTKLDSDMYQATFSASVTINTYQNIFISLTAEDVDAVNLCFHVYQMQDDDERATLVLALRRFFSEQTVKTHRVLLSVEVDEVYGLVMPLTGFLPPHTTLQAADFDQMDACLRIPVTMIRKMAEKNTRNIKLTCSIQIDFEVLCS